MPDNLLPGPHGHRVAASGRKWYPMPALNRRAPYQIPTRLSRISSAAHPVMPSPVPLQREPLLSPVNGPLASGQGLRPLYTVVPVALQRGTSPATNFLQYCVFEHAPSPSASRLEFERALVMAHATRFLRHGQWLMRRRHPCRHCRAAPDAPVRARIQGDISQPSFNAHHPLFRVRPSAGVISPRSSICFGLARRFRTGWPSDQLEPLGCRSMATSAISARMQWGQHVEQVPTQSSSRKHGDT